MKFNNVLNNFTAGQWSEKMLANSDSEEYKKACKVLLNEIIVKQGGAFKRPGLEYSSFDATLMARLQSASALKVIPVKNFFGNFLVFITDGAASTDWFIYDCTSGTAYGFSYVTASIISFVNIDYFQYTQIGDYVYVATGSTAFVIRIEAYPFAAIYTYHEMVPAGLIYTTYPYGPVNSLGRGIPATITSSGTAGAVTLTGSTAAFTRADWDGRYVKFTSGGVTGVALCGNPGPFGPYLTIPATVVVTLPAVGPFGSAAGTSWEKSELFAPRCVTVFEQRLYWAGQVGTVSKVWGSRQGDPHDLMEIPLADDPGFSSYASDNSRPFTMVPVVESGSIVNSLCAAKALYIGMDTADLVARGVQGSLGPNDVSIDSSSEYGSGRVMPQRVDNFMAVVSNSKKSVRDIVYTYENEQFKTVDIGFMSDELLKESKIKRLVQAKINENAVLIALREDGTVLLGTLERNLGIYAWGKLEIGGTSPFVRDVAVARNGKADGSDAIYFVVRRTINGSTVAYLERMANIFEDTTYSTSNMFYYMDSYRVVNSPGSATILAPHLAGATVHVFADANYIGTKTITAGGNLVLDATYTQVIFGLGYSHRLVPAPLAINGPLGNSTGKVKAVATLCIKFWRTITAKYGDPETNQFFDILTRSSNVIAQNSIPLFTGEVRVQFPPGFSRTKTIEIKGDLPFPCNVLSIAVDGTNYD